MVTILFRTIFIYILILGTMRLMGKRQIGELEISELVTALLLSEVASLPITDHEIPIMFAVIPVITLLSLEVFMSVLLIKFPMLKKIISPSPNVIIERGKLRQKELRKIRMTTDELLCELRRSGITSLSEVYYAIVEENGKMSVIPRCTARQPTTKELGVNTEESGISHIIISDGRFNSHGLDTLNINRDYVNSYLSEHDCSLSEVFLLLRDDSGKFTLLLKERAK